MTGRGALGLGCLSAKSEQVFNFGLQMGSVQAEFGRDPEGTLAAVAAVGYRDVELPELYGPRGCPAPRLRSALDHAGLSARSVYVPTALLYRGLERHAAVAASLGCTYLVCANLDPDERRTPGDWHELAGVFNRAGETARHTAGLRVAYLGSDEILLAETDPALVWFELDARAADPRPSLEKHRGRFFALHIGGGGIDPPLLAASQAAGVQRYFVTLDHPAPPALDAVRQAYRAIEVRDQPDR
jgi:sugar phosphate isomerase/epimerase